MRMLPVIARIESKCPIFKQVSTPISLKPIEGTDNLPAAFAFWRYEQSVTRRSASTAQKKIFNFSVKLVGLAPANGIDPVEDARDELYAALLGWEITPDHAPITHVNSEINELEGDVIWVFETFETSIYVRAD